MSSVLDNPSVRQSALRLDTDQYHRLCSAGIIPENTELIAGIVVTKMGKSPLHTWTVQFLADWFSEHRDSDCCVRVEQPITLENSEPEPDIAVVAGSRDDYKSAHPATAQLVVEVAISTQEIDREKADIYAIGDIAEYWLVLPQERQIVVYRKPNSGSYTVVDTVRIEGELQFNDAGLPFAELFTK